MSSRWRYDSLVFNFDIPAICVVDASSRMLHRAPLERCQHKQ